MLQSVLEPLAKFFFLAAFLISIGLVATIMLFLIMGSLPVFEQEGWEFFTQTTWDAERGYGALPMIYGTILVTFLAVCFAFPLGLGSAIISSEVLRGRLRLMIKAVMEILAGVPGVIYGLLGITFLTTAVKNVFGLIDGNTILAAGIILGVMILPTVMTLSDDALKSVPRAYREQALALGLGRSETIFYAVLPNAIKGIVGAVLLGVSRAMGETIAVMLVIGSIDRLPQPIYNIFSSAQTITSKLGREAAEALGMASQWSALLGLGLVLFMMVMAITLIGDIAVAPSEVARISRTEDSKG